MENHRNENKDIENISKFTRALGARSKERPLIERAPKNGSEERISAHFESWERERSGGEQMSGSEFPLNFHSCPPKM